MPYIIRPPGECFRPYITNNPIIYMDGLFWGWDVEARPYHDPFCKHILAEEEKNLESGTREEALEKIWAKENESREKIKSKESVDSEVKVDVNLGVIKVSKITINFKDRSDKAMTVVAVPFIGEEEDEDRITLKVVN